MVVERMLLCCSLMIREVLHGGEFQMVLLIPSGYQVLVIILVRFNVDRCDLFCHVEAGIPDLFEIAG